MDNNDKDYKIRIHSLSMNEEEYKLAIGTINLEFILFFQRGWRHVLEKHKKGIDLLPEKRVIEIEYYLKCIDEILHTATQPPISLEEVKNCFGEPTGEELIKYEFDSKGIWYDIIHPEEDYDKCIYCGKNFTDTFLPMATTSEKWKPGTNICEECFKTMDEEDQEPSEDAPF